MRTTLTTLSLAAFVILGSGCASTVPFTVKHGKLKTSLVHGEGSVAIKDFVDSRSVTNSMQIGGKWEKAKPAYVAKQNRPVAAIVQDGFREALGQAGYQIEANPAATTPTLEGVLNEFWLTDNWGGAVCTIAVTARLREGKDGPVLWEYPFQSKEDDLAIIPNAMVAAMNTLLNSAVDQFSAPEFADAVAGKKHPK